MRSRLYYQLNTALAAFMLSYNIFGKDDVDTGWIVLWASLLVLWIVFGRWDDQEDRGR